MHSLRPHALILPILLSTVSACGGGTPAAAGASSIQGGSGGSREAGGSAGRAEGGSDAASFSPTQPMEYAGLLGKAQNPIVSHIYTADPSARVFEGRIYVYASHDLDEQDDYDMTDYHVFSSDDLVNWQDHGVALRAADIPWATRLYAPDGAYSEATGKYYLYFPNGGDSIGVAVSDSPAGPFVDALGKPLITRSTPGVEDVEWVFDPSCFVDDDGQAYLYFGGGMPDTGDNARVIRLGEDMVSLADESATIVEVPDFFEAAFLHERQGKYYLSYSTTFADHPAFIDYMMSDDPMTGFTYGGTVIKNPTGNNGNNNHHSIVEYEGGWYIFYHNRVLSNREGRSDYQRSITLDTLSYGADGSIDEVPIRGGAVAQLKNLDATARLEAETMADQRGIETGFVQGDEAPGGVAVTEVQDGDWIGYSQVDFGSGVSTFAARVASDAPSGGSIEVFVDGCDMFTNLPGRKLGTCPVKGTGGWQTWTDVECAVDPIEGVHDLYLRFAGEPSVPLLNLDSFRFE